MKDLLKSLKSETHHLVLTGLLALFIIMDIKIPENVAPFFNSVVGKGFVILTSLSLLAINPVVGVFAIVASFELLRRSSSGGNIVPSSSSFYNTMASEPDEENVDLKLTNIPLTLEENVINNMLPRIATDALDRAQFKPTQNNLHGAGKL